MAQTDWREAGGTSGAGVASGDGSRRRVGGRLEGRRYEIWWRATVRRLERRRYEIEGVRAYEY